MALEHKPVPANDTISTEGSSNKNVLSWEEELEQNEELQQQLDARNKKMMNWEDELERAEAARYTTYDSKDSRSSGQREEFKRLQGEAFKEAIVAKSRHLALEYMARIAAAQETRLKLGQEQQVLQKRGVGNVDREELGGDARTTAGVLAVKAIVIIAVEEPAAIGDADAAATTRTAEAAEAVAATVDAAKIVAETMVPAKAAAVAMVKTASAANAITATAAHAELVQDVEVGSSGPVEDAQTNFSPNQRMRTILDDMIEMDSTEVNEGMIDALQGIENDE